MSALIAELSPSFAFGPFLLLPGQGMLFENAHGVAIGRRAFAVLSALVQAHGQIVGKRELLALAWPGLVVEEGNLKVTIAALRRILGEDAGAPRYLATVVGRGYRFIAPVRQDQPGPAPARPGNVAPSTQRIFGREALLEAILRDVQQARLVSLVGPGGVGKTTAALALARAASAAFTGGAWLVELAPLAAPSQVAASIAEMLDRHASQRELLLILDNCEHLIGAVAHCADQLLTDTAHVRLLVTSREPLNIRGERVRRLAGLDFPPGADGVKAAQALAFPAVRLFVERAAAADPSFRLDDANAPAVAAICQRLEGHALAIEQVARRAATQDPAQMLDHLEHRLHMVDANSSGPARHRTLTAALEASYVLLAPREQLLLRRLSTLSGPFSLEAACAAGGASWPDCAGTADDIASLVAKSLLLAQAGNGAMVYRQDHVTRAYATQKLAEAGWDE